MSYQQSHYWGRMSRGQYLTIMLNLTERPDDVPEAKFWLEGSTLVTTIQLPRVKSAGQTFQKPMLLDTRFDDGRYVCEMIYDIDSVTYASIGCFEVMGGEGKAPVIAIAEIDRSLGRAVVTHGEDGRIGLGYKPKRLLP